MNGARQSAGGEVNVTVIIPAVNAPLLPVTVKSLLEQRTARNFEILAVGVFDPATLPTDPQLRCLVIPKPVSAGANRNLALKEARGKYVLFTDADCRPAPDWIERIAARLDEGYRMVGGAYTFPRGRYWVMADNMAMLHNLSPETPGGEVTLRVGGGNMGLWRDVVMELGGFDETFRGGQDNDLAIKLLKAGHKIYFEPRARVEHLHENGSRRELCRHAEVYGRAALALVQRHPDYYNLERTRLLWKHPWLFRLWTPFKAAEQACRVFLGNPAWRRDLHLWPGIWLFFFMRRMSMARGLRELLPDGAPRS
ncbi:MAG: glycosyltransferase [Verrucomicrobia bacterium]|nr:glycosyltransferase [Verrucomicrobiota bacterium]